MRRTFFSKGESGGTICSSVYKKALELIDDKYSPNAYNIYPFHFSDGDNLTSDNARCVKLIQQLMDRSSLFGYGEVNQYSRHSTLMNGLKKLEGDERFKSFIVKEKKDVYDALKHFFKKNLRKPLYKIGKQTADNEPCLFFLGSKRLSNSLFSGNQRRVVYQS